MSRLTFIEGLAVVCVISGIVYAVEVITNWWWLWIPTAVLTTMIGRKVGSHEG